MPLKGRVILSLALSQKSGAERASPAVWIRLLGLGARPRRNRSCRPMPISDLTLLSHLLASNASRPHPAKAHACAPGVAGKVKRRPGDKTRPGLSKRANKTPRPKLLKEEPPPQIKKSESRDSRLPRARKFYEGNPACKTGPWKVYIRYVPLILRLLPASHHAARLFLGRHFLGTGALFFPLPNYKTAS